MGVSPELSITLHNFRCIDVATAHGLASPLLSTGNMYGRQVRCIAVTIAHGQDSPLLHNCCDASCCRALAPRAARHASSRYCRWFLWRRRCSSRPSSLRRSSRCRCSRSGAPRLPGAGSPSTSMTPRTRWEVGTTRITLDCLHLALYWPKWPEGSAIWQLSLLVFLSRCMCRPLS